MGWDQSFIQTCPNCGNIDKFEACEDDSHLPGSDVMGICKKCGYIFLGKLKFDIDIKTNKLDFNLANKISDDGLWGCEFPLMKDS